MTKKINTGNTGVRIAIARGRILTEVIKLFEMTGIDTTALRADDRTLIRKLPLGLEAIIVRSQDVPVYVTRGACSLGITGYDTLREQVPDVFELLDLGIARCRLCLCGPAEVDFNTDPGRHWRVASKYPRLTAELLEAKGGYYEIVPLSGAMETAPETGLADCIVDLVDTGKTLKAHDLVVYEDLLQVSSRLIANKTGFFRNRDVIKTLVELLRDKVAL